jgi:hypothetical protein
VQTYTYTYSQPSSHTSSYSDPGYICQRTGGRSLSSNVWGSQPSCRSYGGGVRCDYPAHITGYNYWTCCRDNGC